jgi:hypothetical protein
MSRGKLTDFQFCPELIEVVGGHLRTCEKCRTETLRLLNVPFVKMILPLDLKKSLEAYDAKSEVSKNS